MEFKLNYTEEEAKKIFFTSDTHFGHKNILEYCKRPYSSVEEMNEVLIKNWNEVVPEDGIIFHLGDFAFGGSTLFNSILPRLNGTKVLILGNHDNKNFRKSYGKYFAEITSQLLLTIDGRQVYLNHYPFLCYGGSLRNPENAVWQLYGHLHLKQNMINADSSKINICSPYQYDVGVDLNNYFPISWKQVKEKIEIQVNNKTNVSYWLK